MILLDCQEVSLAYDQNVVIDQLTFNVKKGDYLYIVGENGSGKSTLAKALLGLKKPSQGRISYQSGLEKNQIGYLAQQIESQQNFPASVFEVVLSGCINQKGPRPFFSKELKDLAREKIALLEIEDLAKKSFQELSGGQRQRVLLARALCSTKALLLLDEPVSGLDPLVTDLMYRTVEELNQAGLTIIMISHDMEAAIQYASHILHLDRDQSFFASKEDYIHSDQAAQLMKGDLCLK